MFLVVFFIFQTISFSCFSQEKAITPPYYLDVQQRDELEKKIQDNSYESMIRLAEYYLWYSHNAKDSKKAISLLNRAVNIKPTLELQLAFVRNANAIKSQYDNDLVNQYLLDLSSIGETNALSMLVKGCENNLYQKCNLNLREYSRRYLAVSRPKSFSNFLICDNYYENDISTIDLALHMALIKMNVLLDVVNCEKNGGYDRVETDFLLKNKVAKNIPPYYVQSIIDYLLVKDKDPKYLEKKYNKKYSNMPATSSNK